MTVRCPDCSATLRVKQERIGSRTHGTCPSCHASVPLKADEERIQVQCTQCGTMLKAPASSAGMQGRCPKCRAAIAIQRPSVHESPVHDAESSVSTQRISVRALGIETMALNASIGTTPTAGGGSSRQATTSQKGTATSLLDAPPPALAHAAEGIKAAAKTIAPASAQTPPAKKGHEAQPAPPRTLAQILEQRERSNDEQLATVAKVKAFSALQGILSGATAGAIVGAIAAVLRSRFDAQIIETFLAPPPAIATEFGFSDGLMAGAIAIVLGGLVGLGTAWTEPPRAEASTGRRFVRCMAFGLFFGLVMAAIWFFNSGNPRTLAGLTPAFNWLRDTMLMGILTGALVSLFAHTKS